MPNATRATVRQYGVAIRAMIVFTAVLGIAYPLVMTGIGQVAMNAHANGSLLKNGSGQTIGSSLIGQSYTTAKGKPLTQWFQTRPSAAVSPSAPNGYDANSSSGSNLGPNNPALRSLIAGRIAVIEKTYGVSRSQIPADAVTASGSGLDPDISPAYAKLQIATVAATRHLSVATVTRLVQQNTHARELGFLGDPVVNVVQLNADLARMDPSGNSSAR